MRMWVTDIDKRNEKKKMGRKTRLSYPQIGACRYAGEL